MKTHKQMADEIYSLMTATEQDEHDEAVNAGVIFDLETQVKYTRQRLIHDNELEQVMDCFDNAENMSKILTEPSKEDFCACGNLAMPNSNFCEECI